MTREQVSSNAKIDLTPSDCLVNSFDLTVAPLSCLVDSKSLAYSVLMVISNEPAQLIGSSGAELE
jgi:hypothetical protein